MGWSVLGKQRVEAGEGERGLERAGEGERGEWERVRVGERVRTRE